MAGKKRLYTAIILSIGALGIAYFYWHTINTEKASTHYFSEQLDNARISEQVIVAGTPYTVINGVIQNGDTLSLAKKTKVLEVAYALALYTYAPVLNLSGTNTEKLQQSVSALEQTTKLLSSSEKTPADAKRVLNLYPIAYLKALAKLEAARQNFITSGKDTDETVYLDALKDAIAAGNSDLASFSQSFNDKLGTSSLRIASFGGTITTERLRAAIPDLHTGLQLTANMVRTQKQCLSGSIIYCNIHALETPGIVPFTGNNDISDNTLAQVAQVRSVLADAYHNPSINTVRLFVLATSTCEAELSGPYIYLPPNEPTIHATTPMQTVNDIFFEKTNKASAGGKTTDYLRDSLDISYVYYNPNTFYVCPNNGMDMSQLVTLDTIATFADLHPTIAQNERKLLSNSENIIYEKYAVNYVNVALKDAPKDLRSPNYRALLSLQQMLTYHSAGLDKLVAQIQEIDSHDLTLLQHGVPFDLSTEHLFLTHSSFPTLFQRYNKSFGAEGVPIKELNHADTEQTMSQYTTYSKLIQTVPRAKIVHDVEMYNNFEK